VDHRAVVLDKDVGQLVQRGLEGRLDARAVEVERDLRVEAQLEGVVLQPLDLQLVGPLLVREFLLESPFLVVHVVADGAAGDRTDRGADPAPGIAVELVAEDGARDRTDGCARLGLAVGVVGRAPRGQHGACHHGAEHA